MAKFFKDDFWGRVRQRMLDLGLSMMDLSRQSQVPYGSIYRQISMEMVPPKREQIEKMAEVLGCSSEYLLTGEDKTSNTLSPEMMELIVQFKMLNRHDKELIKLMINQMLIMEAKELDDNDDESDNG